MRNVSKNFLLFVASLLVFFIVFEIVGRTFIKLPNPYPITNGALIFDQRGFWLHQPSINEKFDNRVDFRNESVKTYSSGLRQLPCRLNTGSMHPRIFIIGDSQTFGWGLSDKNTWANKLQCSLNKNKMLFNVINMGVSATNLDQYVSRIRMFFNGLTSKDIVIFNITWNDYHSFQKIKKKIDPRVQCKKVTEVSKKAYYPQFCPTHKPIFTGKDNTWRRTLYLNTGIFFPVFSSFKNFLTTINFSSISAHLAIPLLRGIYVRFREDNTLTLIKPNTFRSNNILIEQVHSLLKTKTKNILFTFLPSRISYIDELYQLYSKNGTVFPDQDFLWHYVKNTCDKNSLSCLSLFKSLKTKNIGTYDFIHDGHLNNEGSTRVSNTIFKYLKDNI